MKIRPTTSPIRILCGSGDDDRFLFRLPRVIRPAGGEGGGGTACNFAFTGARPDLEQSAFVQDRIHFGNWTISAGLRWDHYQLILNRQAVDPPILDFALFSVG